VTRVYALTKLGKRVYRDSSLDGDEMRIINFLMENKSASSEQLEVVGGEGWLLRSMKRRGLIKELTE